MSKKRMSKKRSILNNRSKVIIIQIIQNLKFRRKIRISPRYRSIKICEKKHCQSKEEHKKKEIVIKNLKIK